MEAGGIRALSRVMEIGVGEYEPGLVAAALRCLSQAASIKAGTGSRTDRKQSEEGCGKGTGGARGRVYRTRIPSAAHPSRCPDYV